jgi:hypothetical protein
MTTTAPPSPLRILLAILAASPHNLLDMVEVRKALGGTREDQNRVIELARRAGLVTGTGREGRFGVTPEQRAANLADGSGFLSIREG